MDCSGHPCTARYERLDAQMWSRTYYPSLGIHRQIYISEHVKGPEHLPLAVRKGRVWNFVQ